MRLFILVILLAAGVTVAVGVSLGQPETPAAEAPTLEAPVVAQQADTAAAEVMATVDALFAAMAAKDTAALASVFHADARLNSTAVRDGRPVVSASSVDDFVRAIGSAGAELDERLGPAEVRVDGALATAWTPYAFFADGEFSHCGVNAFQLVRTDEGWKILQITDSRRRDACPDGAPR